MSREHSGSKAAEEAEAVSCRHRQEGRSCLRLGSSYRHRGRSHRRKEKDISCAPGF